MKKATFLLLLAATQSSPLMAQATNAAPPPLPPSPTTPTVFYQDKFSRRGDLEGSVPDVKSTGDNDWSLSTDQNSYSKASGGVIDLNPNYDAAYLPVNGTSGVPIDGKQDVVLAATMAPDDSGHWMGIGLNAAPFIINQGDNIFNGGVAAITIANGHAEAWHGSTQVKAITLPPSQGKAFVLSLTYRAKTGAITYAIDGKELATLTGVKPEEMAALVAVSMGNGACSVKAKTSNFTLTVGGTD